MKISLDWLKDFVDIPKGITPQKLGEDLTLHVAEVEGVVDQALMYELMVVGEIKEIQAHTNADKLKVCVTDIGLAYPAQIVCGGENIYEGMKVAVALSGAKVRWHGTGELVEMKKTEIRGVESQGMICASAEIGLAESTAKQPEGPLGVMDLKGIDAKAGMPLAKAFGLQDVVIEIDNKSITNRPDLWGHRGLGREVSAVYGSNFKNSVSEFKLDETLRPATPKLQRGEQAQGDNKLSVEIKDNDQCPRYLGLKMDGIKVQESPDWLKQRLLAVGQRPINNLVDISNYVMFELGQPVHIFDSEKLKTKSEKSWKIIVRKSKKGEKLVTLDGVERKLDDQTLIIANETNPIAVAGVMGGSNSEVEEGTTSIIIEAANFEPISIRKASGKLGLRSEASARFEKGLDPHLAHEAILRVADLVKQLNPEATVTSPLVDAGEWEFSAKRIETTIEFIQKRLGVEITEPEIIKILAKLGFEAPVVDGGLVVLLPSWRSDISIPEDIVEEVGRIYGYNKIPAAMPVVDTKSGEQTNFNLEAGRNIKRYLSLAAGLQEVENHIFDYPAASSVLGYGDKRVEIANPLAEGQEYLRRSLLPSLVKNVKDNLRYYDRFGLYEVGRIFKAQIGAEYAKSRDDSSKLPHQPQRLAAILVDKNKSKEEIFYKAKGIAEGLLKNLRLDYEFIVINKHVWLEDGYEICIKSGEKDIGEFGVLNIQAAASQKIEYPVGAIYFDFDFLVTVKLPEASFVPLPELPAVIRDIAVVVDASVKYGEINKIIQASSKLLESVELFDVYESRQIGADKRSLAWHLVFRDNNKTLTSEEADAELEKITNNLKKEFKAELRK